MTGTIVSINVSQGGVPKRPVPAARVGTNGLAGDAQRWEHHGGPLRAVCLWALERIEALRAEGHALEPGAAGENLTLAGIDWGRLDPGAELRVGEVRLRLTAHAAPCQKLEACFADGDVGRISQARHPGWSRLYASGRDGARRGSGGGGRGRTDRAEVTPNLSGGLRGGSLARGKRSRTSARRATTGLGCPAVSSRSFAA